MSARPAVVDAAPAALVQPDGPDTLLVDAVVITATRSVPAVLDELRVGATLSPADVTSGPVCFRETAACADETPSVKAAAVSAQMTRPSRTAGLDFRLATISARRRGERRRRRGRRRGPRRARAGSSCHPSRTWSPAAADEAAARP